MSQHIIDNIDSFTNYKFDHINNAIINTRSSTTPDIDELLEIVAILDNNTLKYELTSKFDLQIKH